jgi:hypothetical protein
VTFGHTPAGSASNALTMRELSCPRFIDRLGDYVEGILPPAEVASMDAHRAGCASCRDLLAEYRRVPGVVRRATDVGMPTGARARLHRLLSRR